MSRRPIFAVLCALLLWPAWSASGNLVGWWPFDETSGNVARDASGQDNDGTVLGTAMWVPGKIGGALQFNGSTYVTCGNKQVFNITDAVTLAAWVQADPDFAYPDWSGIIMRGGPNIDTFALYYNGSSRQLGFKTTGATPNWLASGTDSATAMFNKEWHHIAATYDGTTKVIYIDGTPLVNAAATGKIETSSGRLLIGAGRDTTPPTLYAVGKIDDAQIYDKSLTAAEVLRIREGLVAKSLARDPSPEDGAGDVPYDTVLGWTPGEYAATHDVYLGTTFTDVNTASRTTAKGVLVSQGQAATTYTPGAVLDFGQTYYWRVDEVNKAPDNTIYKGNVWSFTAEPYGYPIPGKSITATASSSQIGMGPENTLNGSGLDENDLHGTDNTTMWLSQGTLPNWIQYQFDKVYKLNDLKVWNSNQLVEPFMGFGAKDVKVEYSTDGTTWTQLPGVPQFARAPGAAGYVANTTVNLGGVTAQYVKLTINSNWGGISPVTGLSEVRFSYVPVQAFAPQPANAATGVSIDTSLAWRSGHEARSHKVYLGTDPNTVAKGTVAAKMVTNHSFSPSGLLYGTTYYWRVDEVNPVTYPGDVWSFTTQQYAVVDDFESYNDDDNRIYDTWIDGLTDGKSGSVVGYMQAPFAEQTIVHGGKQSMPFEYNNVKTPYFSEAERTFAPVQDWTGGGADTLVLYVQGRAPSFVLAGGTYTLGSGGTDIWNTADQFRFAYQSLTGNGTIIARVDSEVAADPWTKAGVMIRESLAAGSRFAAVYATPGNGVRYQARATTDIAAISDTAVITPAQTALTAPVWVKIERIGNVFNGYYSTDGVKWTAMSWNPQTINMTATTVYIGLAVTAHSTTGGVTTAQFSNVSTTGNVTGSWLSQSIGLTQSGNDPGQLYVMVQDSAGKSKVVNYPDLTATTTGTWQEWRVPLSQFTSAGVKMTSVKELAIGVGNRTSPQAGGTGMVYIDDIGYGHPLK